MDNCPVCGNKMGIDYVFDGEDEHKIAKCDSCQWPPPYPMTVDEYRLEILYKRDDWIIPPSEAWQK